MLFVGIGGLWFIPTFHNITKLSPFLGALCVLSVLWVVNEIFNRKLMNADQMSQRFIPRALQYGSIQQILFVMGIMMGMGVVTETGIFPDVAQWIDETIHNIWILGIVSGFLSAIVDSFTIAISQSRRAIMKITPETVVTTVMTWLMESCNVTETSSTSLVRRDKISPVVVAS